MGAEFKSVATLAELPNRKGKIVRVKGKIIALFRIDGEVFALNNICPHQGAPLAKGLVNDCTVTCPLHGWKFNLRTGKSPNGPESATTYEVLIDGDDVKIAVHT